MTTSISPRAPHEVLASDMRSHDTDIVFAEGVEFRRNRLGGGLVATTATVGPGVRVARSAMIRGRAIVLGNVRLFDEAVIEENAVVIGLCTLRNRSRVGGEAFLRGNVTLADAARVDGTAILYGGVKIQHYAHVRMGILSGSLIIG